MMDIKILEILDLNKLDELSHEYAKLHNPEMAEAVANAYRDGIRDTIATINYNELIKS